MSVEQLETVWNPVSSFLFVPHTEMEYLRLVSFLDELTDEIGEDENHPLASLMELVGSLIERYEEDHVEELV